MLSRWFRELANKRRYDRVLEFGCPITHGYDNLAFLEAGCGVTVADDDYRAIEAAWPFPSRPAFTSLAAAPRADLVWSFAEAQLDPGIVAAMSAHADRDVLVFVPNLVNPGAPVHAAYHLLTRTDCHHAERGSARVRTQPGLRRLLVDAGLHVVDSGFVDVPPIPDIAFSIRELRQTLGRPAACVGAETVSPDRVWRQVDLMTRFERSRLVAPFKPFLGHHIYALGHVA
jgi:hypothetical protein